MTDRHGIEDLLALVPPWSVEEKGTLAQNRVFELRERYCRSPRSPDKAGTFVYLDTSDWVNVIALTAEGLVVCIEQFRHGTLEVTLEVPGGMVDAGEDPVTAGLRELREETGYVGGVAELIGRVTPNPAIQNNHCHTVLVRGVRAEARPELDDNEEIGVRLMSLDQIHQLSRDGVIHHALVLAAFHHLMLRG